LYEKCVANYDNILIFGKHSSAEFMSRYWPIQIRGLEVISQKLGRDCILPIQIWTLSTLMWIRNYFLKLHAKRLY